MRTSFFSKGTNSVDCVDLAKIIHGWCDENQTDYPQFCTTGSLWQWQTSYVYIRFVSDLLYLPAAVSTSTTIGGLSTVRVAFEKRHAGTKI